MENKKIKKEETIEVKEITIIDRHKTDKGYNIATALLELEAQRKTDKARIDRLEEGMAFFVEWYKENIDKKIILPGSTEFNKYKPL